MSVPGAKFLKEVERLSALGDICNVRYGDLHPKIYFSFNEREFKLYCGETAEQKTTTLPEDRREGPDDDGVRPETIYTPTVESKAQFLVPNGSTDGLVLEYADSLPSEWNGFVCLVNGNYLCDVLSYLMKMKPDRIRLRFQTDIKAVLLQTPDEKRVVLLMPERRND
jgi:hypothetical protein